MKRIILLLALSTSLALGQVTATEVDDAATVWAGKLEQMKLAGFRDVLMADPGSWPHLSFADAQREPVREMIQLLRDRLSDFAARMPNHSRGLEEDVDLLAGIGRTLRAAGGYANLVLSDALFELAIVRSGNAVAEAEIEGHDWKSLVGRFPENLVPLEPLVAMFEEECIADEIRLPNGNRGTQFDYLWAFTGVDFARTVFMMGIASSSTSTLLRTRSVEYLVARLAGSEKLVRVDLAGYIRFRELGGRDEDLPKAMANVMPFFELFGKEIYEFRSAEYRTKRLSPGDILSLLKGMPRGGVLERMALE